MKSSDEDITCPICFEIYASQNLTKSWKCEHKFCRTCLEEYIKQNITNGEVNLFILSLFHSHIKLNFKKRF